MYTLIVSLMYQLVLRFGLFYTWYSHEYALCVFVCVCVCCVCMYMYVCVQPRSQVFKWGVQSQ